MKTLTDTAKFWIIFAAATIVVLSAAAISWSLQHPFGVHWDEAGYLNEVAVDAQRLHTGAIAKFAGRILLKSWGRPPAYRILAAPFLAIFGFHTAIARLVILACFGLSAWFTYKAATKVSNQAAGAFAALLFCISPQVISASIWYSTEGPLYLACAAMLYYLFSVQVEPESRVCWIGLGAAVGLGLLSKTTFILIFIPVLVFALIASRESPQVALQRRAMLKAAAVALVIAGPWWAFNIKSSGSYAGYARSFARDSLGSPSISIFALWLGSVIESLLGLGFATIIAIALVCATFRIVRNHATFSDLEKMALGACACAGLPIVIAQLSGTNHLLRHISPAIVPLAIAIALLADLAGLIRSKAGIAVCSTLLIGQLLMILYPVFKPNSRALDSGMVNGTLPWRIFIRADQWNWMPVKELSDSCGVAEPTISYLGDGRTLNEAQIEFPWALKGLHADAQLLWRHEDGMIDWTKVMEKSSQSDLVVTAPGFLGDITDGDDLDNQSNADFNQRLQSNPVFQGPVHVHMGRFDPADVVVFVKRNLKCAVPTQEKANR